MVAKLPLALLNDSSSCSSDVLEQVERELLDMLGFLLFANKDKFTDIDDLGSFLMGCHVNIIDTLLGAPIKDKNNNVIDVATNIKNTTFRTTINEMGSMEVIPAPNGAALNRSITPSGLSADIYTILVAIEAVNLVLGIVQVALMPSSENANVVKIIGYIKKLRLALKIADVVTIPAPKLIAYLKSLSSSRASDTDPLIGSKLTIGILTVLSAYLDYKQSNIEGKFPMFDNKLAFSGLAKSYLIISSILKLVGIIIKIVVLSLEVKDPNQTIQNLHLSISIIDIIKDFLEIPQKISEYSMKKKGLHVLSNPDLNVLKLVNSLSDLSIMDMKLSMNSIRLSEVTY